ncbi:NAD(P)-binding domain containing protein [Trema orientale]|uniref:NAD(P)-binding domain containing protein n=1 Tax=Trema orientale TaxID=63057 RepID=A0A2P5E9E5_TREOI|nr:NAD(P)-binding domain containing protein [Trema orientale]
MEVKDHVGNSVFGSVYSFLLGNFKVVYINSFSPSSRKRAVNEIKVFLIGCIFTIDCSTSGQISGACFYAARGIIFGLKVKGTDYNTTDGTCVRDYIDVTVLVDAHVKALANAKLGKVGIYNVGSRKAIHQRKRTRQGIYLRTHKEELMVPSAISVLWIFPLECD